MCSRPDYTRHDRKEWSITMKKDIEVTEVQHNIIVLSIGCLLLCALFPLPFL